MMFHEDEQHLKHWLPNDEDVRKAETTWIVAGRSGRISRSRLNGHSSARGSDRLSKTEHPILKLTKSGSSYCLSEIQLRPRQERGFGGQRPGAKPTAKSPRRLEALTQRYKKPRTRRHSQTIPENEGMARLGGGACTRVRTGLQTELPDNREKNGFGALFPAISHQPVRKDLIL